VADVILATIFSDGLKPGDPLPSQRELAEQLGVSRTVVREAVQSLAAKGIVEIRSGRGLAVAEVQAGQVSESISLFIRSRSLDDYPKVHEVRSMFEMHIAGLAAERALLQDVHQLETICESMGDPELSVDEAARRDVEFHRTLARATKNEIYLVLLDSIGQILLEIRRATLVTPGRLDAVLSEHRAIVTAVRAHDSAAARDAMCAHLRRVEDEWLAQAQRSQGDEP
jgi:GntR family transcriptional repressor for pyruvate dehydrogenase complex